MSNMDLYSSKLIQNVHTEKKKFYNQITTVVLDHTIELPIFDNYVDKKLYPK